MLNKLSRESGESCESNHSIIYIILFISSYPDREHLLTQISLNGSVTI